MNDGDCNGNAEIDAAAMPLYKCHKEVRARKIASIEPMTKDGEPTGAMLSFENPYAVKFVDSAFIARMKFDAECGYYVVYEDGYESWSPTAAFEAGYTRIDFSDQTQAQAPQFERARFVAGDRVYWRRMDLFGRCAGDESAEGDVPVKLEPPYDQAAEPLLARCDALVFAHSVAT